MSYSAIHEAAFSGATAQLSQLIQDGVNVNEVAFDQTIALHHAAAKGCTECVDLLIKNGSKMNVKDGSGCAPLHHAAFAGHASALRLLLDGGAEIELKNETEGASALHLAAFHGHNDCVTLLIQKHADVNSRTRSGDTPLHKACYGMHTSIVTILLEAGASISSTDNTGQTALHYGVYAGARECIRQLLTSNLIDINHQDSQGRTPLHIAAQMGFSECILALISKQAKADLTDNEGLTALKRAMLQNHEPCVRLLQDEDVEIMRLYEQGCQEETQDLVTQADRYGFLLGRDSELRILPSDIKKKLMGKEEERSRKWAKMIRNWKQVAPKLLNRRIKKGIPDCVRGEVWKLVTNAAKIQGERPGDYKQLQAKTGSGYIKQIDLDILRTCRNHIIFHDRYGPGQQSLFTVLRTYSVYNQEVGYCQGMSSVVGLLLMYMEEESAFLVLDLLMEKYSMKNLFRQGFPQLFENFYIHERLLQRFIPSLWNHFQNENITTSMYATKWYLMVFLHVIPFSATLRVWDVMLFEGYRIVFGAALGLLKFHEKKLLSLDFEKILEFLGSLSERYMDCDKFMSLSNRFCSKLRNPYFQRLQNDYQNQGH